MSRAPGTLPDGLYFTAQYGAWIAHTASWLHLHFPASAHFIAPLVAPFCFASVVKASFTNIYDVLRGFEKFRNLGESFKY